MIQLNAAGKRYGHKLLFDGADLLITPRDRVGLVGANGTGKSTFLKILAGLETLDYGSVSVAKGISAGYLPQDGLTLTGRTVFAECVSVFSRLRDMEKELEHLTSRMAEIDHTSAEYEQVAERYHQIEHEFRIHDGYAIDAQVGAVLAGLGFGPEDWNRQTDEFSGGWQMRISLAKLLLQKPNLLLLDEPTNHLDLESRNWLEQYLAEYPFALVLISHDRYFLDVTVNRIVEIWNKKIWTYSGNYEKYLSQKTQRQEQLEAAYRNQKERIEQLEVFINRFRYQATKAKQVQSRIKELEKMERIQLPEEEKTIHFSFPQPKPSGRIVAEFKGVAKSYGEKQVFRNVDFMIERGDRIALVGVNGAGKSTLIKLLSGVEPLTRGQYNLGHNVHLDYFAQDQYKELDHEQRILDDLAKVAPSSRETDLRNLLGCFLFSGDDVFKRIGVLSGGERNRYALLRMLLHPANFLLLDEPTNHLDIRAKDILLNALSTYTGTVVFVSHDRYFIDKLATRVFEIGDGKVEVYPGNYEDFLWRKQGGAEKLQESVATATHVPQPANGNGAGSPPPANKAKRINPIKRKQMEERAKKLEEEIAALESTISASESSLQTFVSAEETARLTQALDQSRTELQERNAEWEQIGEELEATAKKFDRKSRKPAQDFTPQGQPSRTTPPVTCPTSVILCHSHCYRIPPRRADNKLRKVLMLHSTDNAPKPQFTPSTLNPIAPVKTVTSPIEQATIGRSLVIKGEISGSESLYVDGRIEGTISFKEHRVTVGRNGVVAANIVAREVVVMGKVTGNIECSDRVDIRSEGSLTGDIISRRISVEDGAMLRGSVQLAPAEKQEKGSRAEAPKATAAAAGR